MASLCSVSPDPEIDKLVERTGYAAAALTLLPIPGSEILGVMPLHVGMVIGIGHQHGRSLTKESATELLIQIGATVGVSIVGSRLATTAAKFVLPGLGGIIAAPFMFASTLAIGAVADTWFRREGNVSDSELKDLYKSTMRSAKSTFRSDKAKDPEAVDAAKSAVDAAKTDGPAAEPQEEPAMDRLRKAKEMLDEGLIDDAEFAAVKERILGEL